MHFRLFRVFRFLFFIVQRKTDTKFRPRKNIPYNIIPRFLGAIFQLWYDEDVRTFKKTEYKIHVQTNTESVQCLSQKVAYHNKVHVTREQLSYVLAKKTQPRTKHEVDRMTRF